MRAVWAGGGVLGWTNDYSTLAGLKSHKGINLRRYLEVPSNHRKRTHIIKLNLFSGMYGMKLTKFKITILFFLNK